MSAWRIIKAVFALGMLLAGTALMILQVGTPLVLPLMVGSIAWSQVPDLN